MMFYSPVFLRSTAVLLLGLAIPILGQGDPIRPYPLADGHLVATNYLNHSSYMQGLDDHQWYLDNIPFIDIPNKSMQDVYYFRASVVKRHLRWAHEGHGWVVTEFIHPVSWASKLQTIPDSAAHHIVELRWLRDQNYVKNLIEAYTRGGVEKLTGITFTHYIHRGILEYAQASGDIPFLISQLEGMIAKKTDKFVKGLYNFAEIDLFSLPDKVMLHEVSP